MKLMSEAAQAGYFLEIWVGDVRPTSWNPYPTSDLNMQFAYPILEPTQKSDT